MFVDLHVHTYFSDGTQSPEEVARVAREKGLSAISVCDHDTIAAYPRLKAACEANGIRLIQGVEIDTIWRERNLHLLAYAFDPDNPALAELIRCNRRILDSLGDGMIERIAADYPQIDLDAYDAYKRPPERGGWKAINYLFDIGLTKHLEEGIAHGKPYASGLPDFTPLADACAVVKQAGGVPVLAHPGVYWKNNEDELPALLASVRDAGVCGVECYYPCHSESFTKTCVDFCRANGLRVTCGCDGHGEFVRFVEGVEYYIGIQRIGAELLDLRGILD